MDPYLRRIVDARRVDDLWAAHLARMADFGFERVTYGLTRYRIGPGFGRLEDMLLLSNESDAFLREFVHGRMFERSPLTRWARGQTGVCLWRWIGDEAAAGRLSRCEAEVVAFALSHGIRAGVTIAFADASRHSSGAISLCAGPRVRQREVDRLWAAAGEEIDVLNQLFHLRASTLPCTTSARPLTRRQREVLEGICDGRTIAAVAESLGLTPTTVEKHLRLAREALEVETTAQAVAKAMMQRQLFLSADYVETDVATAPRLTRR